MGTLGYGRSYRKLPQQRYNRCLATSQLELSQVVTFVLIQGERVKQSLELAHAAAFTLTQGVGVESSLTLVHRADVTVSRQLSVIHRLDMSHVSYSYESYDRSLTHEVQLGQSAIAVCLVGHGTTSTSDLGR